MIFDILSNSQILGRLDLISNHDLSLGLRLQKMGAQPQTLRSYENITCLQRAESVLQILQLEHSQSHA